jgi:hypothetical protein
MKAELPELLLARMQILTMAKVLYYVLSGTNAYRPGGGGILRAQDRYSRVLRTFTAEMFPMSASMVARAALFLQ